MKFCDARETKLMARKNEKGTSGREETSLIAAPHRFQILQRKFFNSKICKCGVNHDMSAMILCERGKLSF